MMNRSGVLAIVALFVCTLAVSQPSPPDKVPVVLKISRLPDLEMDILVRDSVAFLPVRETFEQVGIQADIDTVDLIIRGFFRNPDSTYTIDFSNRIAKSKYRSIFLTERDIIAQQGGLYVRTGFLNDFFDLDFRYEPRKLLVSLVSPSFNLPAVNYQSLQRRLQAQQRGGGLSIPEPDYVIPRSTLATGIGRLNWDVYHRFVKENDYTNYSLSLDSKLLGGDLDLTARGFVTSRFRENTTFRGFYRYPFPDNTFLQQIIVGHRVSLGILPYDVFGVEFTNRPLAGRTIFSRESYALQSIPNSYVEFSGGAAGTQYARTDSLGNYLFDVPLRYGLSELLFKTNDKYGKINIDGFPENVPQSMISPGTAEYSTFFGKLTTVGNTFVSSNHVNYGVTSRLTIGGAFDYYSVNGLRQKWHSALNSTARIFNSLIFSGTVAPTGSTELVMSWLPQFSSDISLTRAWNSRTNPFNFGLLSDSWGFLAHMSVLKQNLLRVNFDGFINQYYGDYKDYNVNASLLGSFGNIFPRVGMRIIRRQDKINTLTITSLTEFSLSAILPQQIILRTNTSYDNLTKKFFSLEAELARLFFRRFYVNFVYNQFPIIPITTISLNVRLVLPFLDVNATASQSSNSNKTYSVRLTGSADFDLTRPSVAFGNFRTRSVLGGYALHPFIDVNDNSVRDPGEELVDTGRILIQNTTLGLPPVALTKNRFSSARITPYQNYSVYLDPQTLDDPTLVPKYYSVGFTTESNFTKNVDIPLVHSGTIRGSVIDSANIPQEGIPIVLTPMLPGMKDARKYAKKTVTFTTGEFEFDIVRPGKYRIEIDPSQLATYGFTSLPVVHEIVIVSKAGGDVSENQNFKLTRR